MKRQLKQVEDFHRRFGCHLEEAPTADLPQAAIDIRARLIAEELAEYRTAAARGDLMQVADALSDLMYVLLGTYVAHGLHGHAEDLFDEVHRSNMSKLDADGRPVLREDGKILKPETWSPPRLAEVLRSELRVHQQDDADPPPMTAQDYSAANDWSGYFGAVLGKGARQTLVTALDRFSQEGVTDGFAVDLAAGEGRDSLELIRRGWRVLATDRHPEAFSHLWPRVPTDLQPRLQTRQIEFGQTQIPDCDLVNASYALPFCPPADFDGLWRRIVTAVRPGGRFSGQFFGDRDTWATRPDRVHHTRDEVLRLLEGFDIEMLDEEESDDGDEVRHPKHWHLFHVVARKRKTSAAAVTTDG